MAHTLAESRQLYLLPAQKTDWRAAAWAGVIAGLVFVVLHMLRVMVVDGQSPWAPPRMMAAMVLGREVLPPPANFDLAILMAAMLVHIPLSIAFGLLGGWLTHRLKTGAALVAGIVFGLAIYIVNFYLIAPAAFPWFVQARSWLEALEHMIFGLVLAWAYVKLRRGVQAEGAVVR